MASDDGHPPAERRSAARIKLGTAARVRGETGELTVDMLELSFDGALLALPPGAPLAGRECTVTVPFGRDPGEAEVLQARVVRRDGRVCALRWRSELDFDVRFKILRLHERDRWMPEVCLGHLPMLAWPRMRGGNG